MDELKSGLVIKNVRQKNTDSKWQLSVQALWRKEVPGLSDEEIQKRLPQVAFVVQDSEEHVVGVSTAYKAFIKQLNHNLYAYRCFIAPAHRVPGLTSALLVKTRDYLEAIHKNDGPENEHCIGIITLVENERIMEHRREAVWPASKMVYIGNTPKGKHIRVYYFKGARI